MNPIESRTTLAIAGIFAFRLLGLFMILPVFASFATTLAGHSAFWVGLALGIYGLTQGLLQLPLGICSDMIGRRPIIIGGLVVFALGSIVAALSHHIGGIVVGRALQGAGAIGSTLMASIADVVEGSKRSRALAYVGVTIGCAFALAMIVGPLIATVAGIAGIFWVTAGFAIIGIGLFQRYVYPQLPKQLSPHAHWLIPLKRVIRLPALWLLGISIFTMHASMTMMFVKIPLLLNQTLLLKLNHTWLFYLPIVIVALLLVFPLIGLVEAKRLHAKALLVGAVILAISIIVLVGAKTLWQLGVGLCLFFSTFMLLEALLPSLLTRLVPADCKGAATGLFSSLQFLGIFVGGLLGGILASHGGTYGVFVIAFMLNMLWFAFVLTGRHYLRLS